MNEHEQMIVEKRLREWRAPALRPELRGGVLAACRKELAPDWTQRALRVALVAAVLVTVVAEFSEKAASARMAALDAPKRYEQRVREEKDMVVAGTTLAWLEEGDVMD